jgi:hypothetical protein
MSTKAMMGAIVALTAVLASPAFADVTHSTRNSSYDAYAQSVAQPERTQAWQHSRGSVYGTAGQYIGSDPDPFVRSQLARDPSQGGAGMER